MTSALLYDRLQFAFTATFHYLFPQLTMGLALLLLYLRSRALLTDDEHYQQVSDFWTNIFALNFSLEPTGQGFLTSRVESSAKLSPWKESSHFSWNHRFSASCFSGNDSVA